MKKNNLSDFEYNSRKPTQNNTNSINNSQNLTQSNRNINPTNIRNRNRKKKKKQKRAGFLLALILIFVILMAIAFIFNKFYKDTNSNNNNSKISSISNNSSKPESSSKLFWGDKIDLDKKLNPIVTGEKLDKWPESSGFESKSSDISTYLNIDNNDMPLKGITVILDPGHGGEDLGAVYPRAPKKPIIIESRVNLKIAFLTKEYLENMGAKVLMTREDDTYYKLYYRSAIVAKEILSDFYSKLKPDSKNAKTIESYQEKINYALEINDDSNKENIFYGLGVNSKLKNILDIQASYKNYIYLSIHCNSSEKADTMKGSKAYYSTNKAVYDDELKIEKDVIYPEYQNYDDVNRKKFANIIFENIIKYEPLLYPNQTTKPVDERNYSVIREQNLVSALVELGYVNHKSDIEILNNTTRQKELAKVLADSIYEYYCK